MGAFDDLAKTPNLSLNVPTYEDNCDVEALNENAFILDNEVQAIKDGYLPLKGGTMIGDISYDANNPFVIYTKKLANEIQVGVGTNVNDGGRFIAYGNARTDSYKGAFKLRASDGTNSKELLGSPDGSLIWNQNPVAVFEDGKLKFPNGNLLWIE